MKHPDFLVIGAQKAGTTTLFSLLSKHPNIYLPPGKEVQFFSNDLLYAKGAEWYFNENFQQGKASDVKGEVSPQYMCHDKVPGRIKELLPNIKFIMILRHPLKRAFSHYQMSVRRGRENRGFLEAFADSLNDINSRTEFREDQAYYRHSDYMQIIRRYLTLFSKEQFLVVFLEDLELSPELVLGRIYKYLELPPAALENPAVRLHAAGEIKYLWLNRFLRHQGVVRWLLKRTLPFRLRAAIKWAVEQFNITTTDPQHVPEEALRDYNWFVMEQKKFLEDTFAVHCPWQEWNAPK